MPQIFTPNLDPRYYAQPASFRCTIGAAAITSFPGTATVGGIQASGTLTFSSTPATAPVTGSSVTINGVTVTFVTTGGFSLRNALFGSTILSANGTPLPFQAIGPYGLQVAIGSTVQETIANLVGLLRSFPDENLQKCNYRVSGGNVLTIVAATTGTGGNAYTLAASTSPASNITASGSTLSGGTASTSGYAVLVEPQPQPVEIQTAAGICRASQTAGTMTLFKSDGVSLSKSATATFASATAFGASQENSPIPFIGVSSGAAISAAAPLLVPPWTGLYAYGSTTQVIDIETGAGGPY